MGEHGHVYNLPCGVWLFLDFDGWALNWVRFCIEVEPAKMG